MTACIVVRLHHAGRGELKQLNDEGTPTKMRGSEPWVNERDRNKPLAFFEVMILTLHHILI